MTPLLLIVGGGKCRACIDVRESTKEHRILGQIESPELRLELFGRVRAQEAILPFVASRGENVSRHSTIGEATVVMNGATIYSGAQIGPNCIMKSPLVEHAARIEAHTHISTEAVIRSDASDGRRVIGEWP